LRFDIGNIKKIAPDIYMIIINIPDILRSYFSDQDTSDLRGNKNILISDHSSVSSFFDPGDIDKINGFRSFKRQIEWISGRMAIKMLFNILKNDPAKTKTLKNPVTNPDQLKNIKVMNKDSGAPFINNQPEYHISISHSNKYSIGLISTNKNIRAGCDLEKIEGKKPNEFMNIAFSEREINYLNRMFDQQLYVSWTIKEAFLKYLETGFHENLKKVEILKNRIFYKGEEQKNIRIITDSIREDYIYSVVYNSC